MRWLEGWNRLTRLRALGDKAAIDVASSILTAPSEWAAYGRGLRTYLGVLAQSVLIARELSSFIEVRGLRNALFYDYWFENLTLALAILRVTNQVSVAVSRAHRFDLFDEAWPSGTCSVQGIQDEGPRPGFPSLELRAAIP